MVVSLLTDKGKFAAEMIKEIISDGIIGLLFDGAFPRPFIASAERTGAGDFFAKS